MNSIWWKLTNIYALIMSMVSALVILIESGCILGASLDILIPQYKHLAKMEKFSSTHHYLQYLHKSSLDKKRSAVLGPELKQEMLDERDRFLVWTQKKGIENIINFFPWFFVSIVSFFIHWRMHRKFSTSNSPLS
jgi:hypothetical protein